MITHALFDGSSHANSPIIKVLPLPIPVAIPVPLRLAYPTTAAAPYSIFPRGDSLVNRKSGDNYETLFYPDAAASFYGDGLFGGFGGFKTQTLTGIALGT